MVLRNVNFVFFLLLRKTRRDKQLYIENYIASSYNWKEKNK